MRSTISQVQAYACAILIASFFLFSPITAFANEAISREQAIQIVEKQYGGKVLKAKNKNGSYEVKLLTDSGKVRIVQVDAHSGTILSPQKK